MAFQIEKFIDEIKFGEEMKEGEHMMTVL